jgi:hypothetical protein
MPLGPTSGVGTNPTTTGSPTSAPQSNSNSASGPRMQSGGGVIDLPDPRAHRADIANGKPKFPLQRYGGPFITGGVKPKDVVQGYLDNCYMPAAFAAMAHTAPEGLKKAMQRNADGTFTFHFRENGGKTAVIIDPDLYTKGKLPLYGAGGGTTAPAKMELWYPLFEKAYAAWKGSYGSIGDGGFVEDVFADVLGLDSTVHTVKSADAVWKFVSDSVGKKRPTCIATFGNRQKAKYKNTGIETDHFYTVLDVKGSGANRMVQMRNPWGESEPKGNGKDDGVFWVSLDVVTKLFEYVVSGHS